MWLVKYLNYDLIIAFLMMLKVFFSALITPRDSLLSRLCKLVQIILLQLCNLAKLKDLTRLCVI